MAYTKTIWEDLPQKTTPITASNLNKIEDELETLETDVESALSNIEILNNYLKIIPAFPGIVGDGAVATINLEPSLDAFYLWISTHINIREIYMITFYPTIGVHIDKIFESENASHTSFTLLTTDGQLEITAAVNCRGQLYRVSQALNNS